MKNNEIRKLRHRALPWKAKAASVSWRSWGRASFAEAEERNLPVFLFMTAPWSARSRTFEAAVLSNRHVIRQLNRRFVPIRIDVTRRPDISERYASNGWPALAILTPDGDVMVDRHLIKEKELMELLENYSRLLENQQPEDTFEFQGSRRRMVFLEFDSAKYRPPAERDAIHLASMLANSYDKLSGSFGENKSTPNPAGIELLLKLCASRPEYLEIAKDHLDKIADDGLYDTDEGGFFRASASSPSREKLLSANADLISLYLLAYRLTRSHAYHKAAFQSLAFIEKHFVDSLTGTFFAGIYEYSDDGASNRHLDRTIHTNWNHRMVITYLDAYEICGDERYLERALTVLDCIWGRCFDADEGMAHYLSGELPRFFGYLDDQAWAALAFAKAYAVTGERGHIIRALEIVDVARSNLHDSGGFYDIPYDPDAPGLLKLRLRPVEGNALLARALTSINELTGDSDCANLAKEVIGTLKVDTTHPSAEVSQYALGILSACSLSNTGRQAA